MLTVRLDKEYYISHLIIAQLFIRGEPIESFKEYVAGLRHSNVPDRRRFGAQRSRIWPEIAQAANAPPIQKGEGQKASTVIELRMGAMNRDSEE